MVRADGNRAVEGKAWFVGDSGDCNAFSEDILLVRGGGGTGLVLVGWTGAAALLLGFESSRGRS